MHLHPSQYNPADYMLCKTKKRKKVMVIDCLKLQHIIVIDSGSVWHTWINRFSRCMSSVLNILYVQNRMVASSHWKRAQIVAWRIFTDSACSYCNCAKCRRVLLFLSLIQCIFINVRSGLSLETWRAAMAGP